MQALFLLAAKPSKYPPRNVLGSKVSACTVLACWLLENACQLLSSNYPTVTHLHSLACRVCCFAGTWICDSATGGISIALDDGFVYQNAPLTMLHDRLEDFKEKNADDGMYRSYINKLVEGASLLSWTPQTMARAIKLLCMESGDSEIAALSIKNICAACEKNMMPVLEPVRAFEVSTLSASPTTSQLQELRTMQWQSFQQRILQSVSKLAAVQRDKWKTHLDTLYSPVLPSNADEFFCLKHVKEFRYYKGKWTGSLRK